MPRTYIVLSHFGICQSLQVQQKEHFRKVKTATKGSRIANHAWSHVHAIEFENAIIDKGGFRTRKTLEAQHTKLTSNADNNSCELPDNMSFFLTNIHNYSVAFSIFSNFKYFIQMFSFSSLLVIHIFTCQRL